MAKTRIQQVLKHASRDLHRIHPGQKVRLDKIDPSKNALDVSRQEAEGWALELHDHLIDLQELLYAEHRRKILIVLQAMDTAGKDGVIRHVFRGVNPQGVRVSSFKVPTPLEQDHDYLWRIHQQVPAKGEIVVFNRSHYEDVLVTRVHGLIKEQVWRRRYGHIRDFEKMLTDEGVTILKFYLHIDRKEQKSRLQARLEDPAKTWKFSASDVKERTLWPAYMEAYQEAIASTSTHEAPWYVIPANKKWYRNLAISLIIVDQLQRLGMDYPHPKELIKPSQIV